MDRRTDVHLKPTLLGRLGVVDLITSRFLTFLHSLITIINNLLLKINHLLFSPNLHDFSRILLLELVFKEANVSADILPAIAELGQCCFEHFQHTLSRHHLILPATTPAYVRLCAKKY